MEKIAFEYDLKDLVEIVPLMSNPCGGLDFRFKNYSHEDISVETTQWKTIQEFMDWYANKSREAE